MTELGDRRTDHQPFAIHAPHLMRGQRHYASLDGVRAVAVIAVVALHAATPIQGGAFGVDVFFVLSGFLITGLLWDELRESGAIARRRFYLRRGLRLFPALASCCVLTAVIDHFSSRGGGHLAAVPAVLFYVANWYEAARPQSLGFFGQTWSLAIEEQFYLFWPPIILLLSRSHRPARWLVAIAFVAAATRGLSWIGAGQVVGLWTTSRLDELTIGSLAAVVLRTGWVPRALLGYACSAIVVSLLVLGAPNNIMMLGGLSGLSAAVAVVLIWLVRTPAGIVGWFLARQPLTAIGRVSYGVYLYHYPVLLAMAAAGYGRPRYTLSVGLALTAGLTVASWVWIEKPALALKNRWAGTRLTGPSPLDAPA